MENSNVNQCADPEKPAVTGQAALELTGRILDAMGLDLKPTLASESSEEIQIELEGSTEDIARIIGRHGQTLDALQYLLGIILNSGAAKRVRVMLDAEGYRQRAAEAIEAKARAYAAQVKESGSEAVLDPQNARDRRIIHMALKDDPDVCTYSEGEGGDRRVVISPRK